MTTSIHANPTPEQPAPTGGLLAHPLADQVVALLAVPGPAPTREEFAGRFSLSERFGELRHLLEPGTYALADKGHVDLIKAMPRVEGAEPPAITVLASVVLLTPEKIAFSLAPGIETVEEGLYELVMVAFKSIS